MSLASTFGDLCVGLDIHFEIVPLAGPVPLPHPFLGVVDDPAGLAAGMAFAAAGGSTGGPVLINSMPATNVGTSAFNELALPHFVLPPGVAWAPMPKPPAPALGGKTPKPSSPATPDGSAIAIMGSMTVHVMGSSQVRLGDTALSCAEPARMPSTIIALPKGAPVMVGGAPAVSTGAASPKRDITDSTPGSVSPVLSRTKPQRVRNRVDPAACFLTGHPVDVATGRVLTQAVDWQPASNGPLRFERAYSSGFASRNSVLGRGWSHSLDEAAWRERGRVVVRVADGRELELDVFGVDAKTLQNRHGHFDPLHRMWIRLVGDDGCIVRESQGVTKRFARVPGDTTGRWRITGQDAPEDKLVYTYDGQGNLATVRDARGRELRFEHDAHGKLRRLLVPHPEIDGVIPHCEYRYDARGDLIAVLDALGNATQLAYEEHLLVRETDRNGHSFYFGYDGVTEEARCIRTWGDGGAHDQVIDYDKPRRATFVTDARGYTQSYFMDPAGCVLRVVEPTGATHEYDYDQHFRRVAARDPLGHETAFQYDPTGRCRAMVDATGNVSGADYDERGQPIRVYDGRGGEWRREYDADGRLVRSVAPTGHATHYEYEDRATPYSVSAMVDEHGRRTSVARGGGWTRLVAPDGSERRYRYDRWDRLVETISVAGCTRRQDYDSLGRLIRATIDGVVEEERSYDAAGNLVRFRTPHLETELHYEGSGRLKSRRMGRRAVEFEYDAEGNLTTVVNEAGERQVYWHDPAGRIVEETGFDGRTRRMTRDVAGRVIEETIVGGHTRRYSYDESGRVTRIEGGDGSWAAFAYDAHGSLRSASNDAGTVEFSRDPNGRVFLERFGETDVRTQRDGLGHVRSVVVSNGPACAWERGPSGEVLGLVVTSGSEQSPASWEQRLFHDAAAGLSRWTLPGGGQVQWQFDTRGRPSHHVVRSSRGVAWERRYHWGHGWRLLGLDDSARGRTQFRHDPRGALIEADGEAGRTVRAVDDVDNVYRSDECVDRKYGAAGQLLVAETGDGVVGFTYDPGGRLVSRTEPDGRQWTLAWSDLDMLTSVTTPDGVAIRYEYDALGRRIAAHVGERITRWRWNGDEPIACMRDDGTQSYFVFAPEAPQLLAVLDGDRRAAVVTDHLGVPLMAIDDAGTPLWSVDTDIYGRVTPRLGDATAIPFRFPGQLHDPETGLHYNRFRYYSPDQGIYISQDPLGLAATIRPHAYVRDPLVWADPQGLRPVPFGPPEERTPRGPEIAAGGPAWMHTGSMFPIGGAATLVPIGVPKPVGGVDLEALANEPLIHPCV